MRRRGDLPPEPGKDGRLQQLDQRLAADPTLLARFRAGDHAVMTEVVRCGGPVLTGLVAQYLGRRLASHVPDVVQRVWQEVLETRATFGQREANSLAGWLHVLAVRRAMDFARVEGRRARRFVSQSELAEAGDGDADPEGGASTWEPACEPDFGDSPAALRAEDGRVAMALLGTLPKAKRDVVTDRALKGRTIPTTAKARRLTPAKVRAREARGLALLAEGLRAHHEVAEPDPDDE